MLFNSGVSTAGGSSFGVRIGRGGDCKATEPEDAVDDGAVDAVVGAFDNAVVDTAEAAVAGTAKAAAVDGDTAGTQSLERRTWFHDK